MLRASASGLFLESTSLDWIGSSSFPTLPSLSAQEGLGGLRDDSGNRECLDSADYRDEIPPEWKKVRAGPISPEALQGSDSLQSPQARATHKPLTFGTNRLQATSSLAALEYSRPGRRAVAPHPDHGEPRDPSGSCSGVYLEPGVP